MGFSSKPNKAEHSEDAAGWGRDRGWDQDPRSLKLPDLVAVIGGALDLLSSGPAWPLRGLAQLVAEGRPTGCLPGLLPRSSPAAAFILGGLRYLMPFMATSPFCERRAWMWDPTPCCGGFPPAFFSFPRSVYLEMSPVKMETSQIGPRTLLHR